MFEKPKWFECIAGAPFRVLKQHSAFHGSISAYQGHVGREQTKEAVKDKLRPEDNSQVLDLVPLDGEDVGDEEAAEKEEGVDGEEALLDGFKGARVLQLIQSPQRVVQVVDGKEKRVSKNHPGRYCTHTL